MSELVPEKLYREIRRLTVEFNDGLKIEVDVDRILDFRVEYALRARKDQQITATLIFEADAPTFIHASETDKNYMVLDDPEQGDLDKLPTQQKPTEEAMDEA